MGGKARVGVEIVAPGKLVHLSTGHIDFGELAGRESDRAKTIQGIFWRAWNDGRAKPQTPHCLVGTSWSGTGLQYRRDADPAKGWRTADDPEGLHGVHADAAKFSTLRGRKIIRSHMSV